MQNDSTNQHIFSKWWSKLGYHDKTLIYVVLIIVVPIMLSVVVVAVFSLLPFEINSLRDECLKYETIGDMPSKCWRILD